MTNKTINGVPRDLLERVCGIRQKSYDIEDAMHAGAELRALLAAPDPIVEADGIGEPVAWMNVGSGDVTTCSVVVMDWDDENEQVKSLYSADQLAHLQSTIAQLNVEIARIKKIADNYYALGVDANLEIAQLKAGNERLRDGPIYQVQYLGEGGGGWSDADKDSYDAKVPHPTHWKTRIVYACLDEVRRMDP